MILKKSSDAGEKKNGIKGTTSSFLCSDLRNETFSCNLNKFLALEANVWYEVRVIYHLRVEVVNDEGKFLE